MPHDEQLGWDEHRDLPEESVPNKSFDQRYDWWLCAFRRVAELVHGIYIDGRFNCLQRNTGFADQCD